MKPYKLKHKPSGLYYQPHKYRGSNISIRGKIYQTKTHGLSSAIKTHKKYPDKELYSLFPLFTEKGSRIHKLLSDMDWVEVSYCRGQLKCYTKISDWEIEEV